MKYDDVIRGLDLAANLLRKQGLMTGDAAVRLLPDALGEEKIELYKPMEDGVLTISYTPNPRNIAK